MNPKKMEKKILSRALFGWLILFAVLSGCAETPSKTETAYLLERDGYKAYQEHRWVDAEKDYRQAANLDPLNLKDRNNLSVILHREGKEREAGTILEGGQIASSPAGDHILISRAHMLLEQHQYPQAKEILDPMRYSRSWPPGFKRLMAYADIRTGHYGEASILLHEIIRKRPRDPVVLGYLSIVYKKEGAESLARKSFHRALELSRSSRFRKSLALLFNETENGAKNAP
jgi:Flp pilus assembly protein TadD